jgi:hypothetical protein
MRFLRRLLLLAIFVGLFWVAWDFTHGNDQLVEVQLFEWTSPPLAIWIALLTAFGLGFASASAGLLFQLGKKSLTARHYRKAVTGLESEVHQLRNLPLAGADAPAEVAPPVGGEAGSGR